MTYSTKPKLTDPFEVTKEFNVFSVSDKKILFQKICNSIYLIFSVIIFPMGITRWYFSRLATAQCLPASNTYANYKNDLKNKQYRSKVLAQKNDFHLKGDRILNTVKITTADGVTLDTSMIQNINQMDKPTCEQKWIIYFCGNAVHYENYLEELYTISKQTGASIYTGNYRGIMHSQGWPTSSHDLVLDGEAMVQKLLSTGVQAKNILLHGFSLGGGVAAKVCALHQEPGNEMHLCSDRSFSTFINAARGLFPGVGGLLGVIALLNGWKFNSLKHFESIKGHKFVIVSKKDPIISYSASLYTALKKYNPEKAKSFKDMRIKLDVESFYNKNNLSHKYDSSYEHSLSIVKFMDEFNLYQIEVNKAFLKDATIPCLK